MEPEATGGMEPEATGGMEPEATPDLLSAEEARVLGGLLEKSALTPDNYPLTLNALRQACNQTSSRQPVVEYSEPVIESALAALRQRGMVRVVLSPSNRPSKYRHVLDERFGLDDQEKAVLCLLLLRGPQTLGELRQRSDRLADFDSLEEVESALRRLAEREGGLVERLERRAGQKEARYRQLLAEEPPLTWDSGGPGALRPANASASGPSVVAGPPSTWEQRLAEVEAEVSRLRGQVERLSEELGLSDP